MRQPSFNTWTIIFLLAAIQGVFVSLVFLIKKEKHPSRKFLSIITFLFSAILVEYVLFWTGFQFYYPYLIAVSVSLYFLFGPLFYLYFRSVFDKILFKKYDFLHFLPFSVSFFWFSPFIFKSVKEKQFLLTHHQLGSVNVVMAFVWAGITQLIIYQIIIFKKFESLSKLNREIRNWFLWIFGLFSGFILSYVSYYILSRFSFFNSAWDYMISLSMLTFIYFVAWFGYMQPKIFSGFSVFDVQKIKYKNSPVSSELGKKIIDELQETMKLKKYFLQSDLSLERLSELTNNNKHYLSQAINEQLGINFFEYINLLRIEEAQSILKTQKQLTIIEVAYQVGYNNKVSFNKAFKNITGKTPSEYRSEHV